jgi:hypothetical protein
MEPEPDQDRSGTGPPTGSRARALPGPMTRPGTAGPRPAPLVPPPGGELAAALARAAGPEWRCGSATGEEAIGLLRQFAALQSWAGAGMLGMIRALIRDEDFAFLGRARHGDLPDVWDDSLVHEIALALAVSAPSAAKTTRAAWELGARLPGGELLLKEGTLDLPRARLIAEVFQDLSDEDAARAEELLLPHLTEPPRKTYTQIERLATAIAAAVDPGLAERQRKDAERHRSRVQMFREQSGTAALHLPHLQPPRPRQRLRARHPLRPRRLHLRLQRRRPQPQMPPRQTITWLEPHPAQTRMAPMDNPQRTHLHPRTQAIPGISAAARRSRAFIVRQFRDLPLFRRRRPGRPGRAAGRGDRRRPRRRAGPRPGPGRAGGRLR